jgi:excinuclease UvrABC ATPase subunit
VSVELPKHRLTVFTGVSGSGNGRLGLGQELARLRDDRRGVAAADQRDLQRLRSGLHADARAADVDVLEGLTTAIVVDRRRLGADPRSTVGSATDANAAADPLLPARAAARRLAAGVDVERERLDEPTTELHLADVEQLLGLLGRLVDSGRSVVVVEHRLAVIAHADWLLDLGPGAGHDGGRVVFEGTPADLVAARSTLTGEHLAAHVQAA